VTSNNGLEGAGITAKERLTNIERLLEVIDGKLDDKVGRREFDALQKQTAWLWRIVILATGGLAAVVWLLEQGRIG